MLSSQCSKMETFLIILAIIGGISGVPNSDRIFNGTPASPGQFPFIVSVNDPQELCGGVIIDTTWILTAANCLIEASTESRVLVGTTSQHSGGSIYGVKTIIVHEDFDNRTLKNNIGLIQINGQFTFNAFVQAIDLADAPIGSECATAGWGMTESEEIPEDLRYIEVTTISLDDCVEYDERLSEEQVCAQPENDQGFCFGDAGGPLVCGGRLVGLASYAIFPCGQGVPDVYTRVISYADWIDENIAQ